MLTNALFCAVAAALLAVIVSGQEAYNVTRQICCDGKVHDKQRGLQCCGQDTYNRCEQGCCVDQIVDYPNPLDDNFACCYDVASDVYSAYDPMTQQCCQGLVVQLPRLDVYYQCCGADLYDSTTQTCCADQVHEMAAGVECCGESLVQIEEGSECCGGEIIESETQLCCTTWEYNEKTQMGEATYTVEDKTDDVSVCCGNMAYDSSKAICCAKYQLGKTSYYTLGFPEDMAEDSYPICCGDELLVNDNKGLSEKSCCYGSGAMSGEDTVYDSTTQQCCNGNVQPISEDSKSCCWMSGELYDIDTQVCTAAGVKDMSEDDGEVPAMQDYCMPNGPNGNSRYY